MNVGAFLTRSAIKYADKVCLIEGEKKITYKDFNKRVNLLANALKKLGFKKGQTAGLYLRNRLEWAEIYYALSKLGLIIVPINFNSKANELVHIFKDSGLSLIFIDQMLQENIKPLLLEDNLIKKYVVLGDKKADWYLRYEDMFNGANSDELNILVEENDVHTISYTSGTTGLAKGVELTNSNVIFGQYYTLNSDFGFSSNDISLVTTSLAHRVAWSKLVNTISSGASLYIMKKFSAGETMEVIEQQRITIASLVPTIANLILQLPNLKDYNTSALRMFFVGGENFPPKTRKKLKEAFPHVSLISYYASTEAGMISSSGDEDILKKPTSVGLPVPGADVRVVDDSGKDVPTGEVGEILMKCGKPGVFAVMKQYHNNPEATKATFLGDSIRTGDVGKFDKDGYLYIVDRKRDMIISGGYNIYSREVEQVIESHPMVKEVAVVGVPDEVFGESVKAFVVVKSEQGTTQDEVMKEELIDLCQQKMASYKKPKYIEFIDCLPRNSVGKVAKYLLKSKTIINDLHINDK